MNLKPGDKLGPYEIVSAIGKGGMGEVWRARDPRLSRDVAIKVSADRFSDRFEKEARAIAALNHSNICTLFDVGPNYLVMEHIEGSTLADRIGKGAIPLEEALTIARQIGSALDAAHEKGIVHRDLKPENVKIRPDGSVKVLDFGLAKAVTSESKITSDSPTLTQMPTQVGVILGTAAYMAPEQARGQEVDRRADIWAFGVLLCEMVTGQKLFRRDNLPETLAAVMRDEPDLESVPAKVRRLVQRCLEKDPRKRLRDIGDAWDLLNEPEIRQSPAPRGTKWIAAAGAMAAIAAVALWTPWRNEKPVDLPLVRLDVDLGADVSLPASSSLARSVVLSPDGTRLLYVSGSPLKLFIRRLDQPKAIELPGTEGIYYPFFSSDGRWVGFQANRKLNKVSVDGGAAIARSEIARPAPAFNKRTLFHAAAPIAIHCLASGIM